MDHDPIIRIVEIFVPRQWSMPTYVMESPKVTGFLTVKNQLVIQTV